MKPLLLFWVGVLDLLLAAAAFIIYALAMASQYSGFCYWISSLTPNFQPDTPAAHTLMTSVLNMLDRTQPALILATAALALNGAFLIYLSIRAKR